MPKLETLKLTFVICHIIKNESKYIIPLVKYTIPYMLIIRIIIVECWEIRKKY